MLDVPIVASFSELLHCFVGCFTAPSFDTFHTLMSGWVLNLGRHTITATVRVAGAVGWKHISSFHRFFSQACWAGDALGLVLIRLVIRHLPDSGPVVVAVDDTLGRHTGKRIGAASMHRDPLLSTRSRPFLHWGHLWVVVGITIRTFDKTWCLPVLVRLYRSKKRCAAEGRTYRTCQALAVELLALLAKALPERQIVMVGDADYTNSTLIKGRPSNVTILGRSRLDAAIYEPPPPRRPGQMGRPRVRGARLPSPQEQAADPKAAWRRVKVAVYGKTVTVRVLVINALWYVAGGSGMMRLVLVRGFPGHKRDDVFVCTDETMSAARIIETFAMRWSLEVTFHDAKGKFGFEDPQNRNERAVERTAPMALWCYSLTVLWYVTSGQSLPIARTTNALPWYPKAAPTFADMLATLRRASWAERLFDPQANDRTFRKRVQPLMEYLDACA
jgi:hypothetical protein